ncbi:MAG: hypothetical protein HY820_26140 [Acidobacteria bacterium]|nr:hypothetical protein [Acidobacteriota bacterium]
MSRQFVILGAIFAIAAPTFAWQAQPPKPAVTKPVPPKTAAAKPKPEPPKPYTLERIIEKLDIIRRNKFALNENILKNQLKLDGVAFVPSDDDLAKLKRAGASEDFLRFLVELKKDAMVETPPPPPAEVVPPKPKEGRMVLTCKPIDCQVSINGQSRGQTTKGTFTLDRMPEGAIKISVSATDHFPDRDAHNAVVRDRETINVDFVLKPTPAGLDRTGAELASKMISVLGGENAYKEFARIRITGGRLLWSKAQGTPNNWFFNAFLKMPNEVKFLLSRGGKQQEIFKLDTGFGPLPADKAEEMEEALRDFWDYQFGRMLEKLVSPSLKRTARQLKFADNETPTFRLEGSPDTYVVTLDPQTYPKEIRIESSGLTNGLRVQYGEFTKTGAAFYPKAMFVNWPGATPRTTEVRIESVDTGPSAVKDADVLNKKAKGRKR